MRKGIEVTVLIVNYNGLGVVERCVRSVLSSSYSNLKVVVVDNNSSDGSLKVLKSFVNKHKNFSLTRLSENLGPAYARNFAMKKIKSKYVAFLDNDTLVKKDWLNEPIKRMEEDSSIGSCQCKLLIAYDRKRFDYIGDYVSQFGFLVQKCATGEKDEGQYNREFEILSAKSAGMVIRKEAFDKVGGFDDDYFIYVEETDLGWRLWLYGYRNVFTPHSVVYHEYGTTAKRLPKEQNYRVKFHGTKNYILTLLKCLSATSMIKILPIHLFLWVSMAFWFLLNGNLRNFFYIMKAILWNVAALGSMFKKRANIQKFRVISDKELFKKIMVTKDLSYFYNKLVSSPSLKGVKGYSKS
ncbi:hypothetical protein A2716_03645 [candidate division WWE3 bacterium RIFCSPHIGHO2_01_FULL_40_23]|nr:MAG: hypothetical protein A2716_03645 [candidate division WWE3 bacterium RIFCSPHIGHO2_01_FULL_40_23]